ncbi:MAG TPA: DinB family protein [Candidatus Acidoferrales bacterium]|nr:DinB family protein [Candidatus Acidoferrales bacterium]
MAMKEKALRDQLKELLAGGSAHADWKKVFAGMPAKLRGVRPEKLPYSAWELLEHLRIAQHDILEFSRNAKYVSPKWPEGYWPVSPEPRNTAAWDASLKSLARDLAAMQKLVANPKTDLMARIPHGTGQTLLREALLLADHTAYHLGQVVLVRRLLGAWEED